jgi:DNA (cytosine-5)-methyltransferase 1
VKDTSYLSKLYALDFFCGAGGLTRGFLDAGLEVLLGIDIDSGCEETYKRNNPPAKFLCADIATLHPSSINHYLRGIPRNQLVFVACAPCQPFAVLNKSGGSGRDAFLLREFARFVEYYKPRFVVVENVPGIARVRGASTLARFKNLLRRLKYNFDEDVLDGKNYGVPQTRRRYILLAKRRGKIKLPAPTFGNNHEQKPFRTVRQAISHLPRIKAGHAHKSIPNHVASPLSPKNLLRLRATPPDGGDRRSWPTELLLKCHENGHDGHTDVYGRMFWDRYAPTLTGKCNSLSNGRYGHPTQTRAITLREAAALQSFRDSYRFYGNEVSHIAQRIGNAVPVVFAKALGKHLSRSIKSRNSAAGTSSTTKKMPHR